MNRRGFTLVELLGTLLILGLIVSLVVVGININFNNAKDKTEEVFISTIEDALDVYLDSDAKKLKYDNEICTINKTHGVVKLYKANNITLYDVINSSYKPLIENDLVNPSNEDTKCNPSSDIEISIYRDSDYIYYYKVNKSEFGCLKSTGNISNLPSNVSSGCTL